MNINGIGVMTAMLMVAVGWWSQPDAEPKHNELEQQTRSIDEPALALAEIGPRLNAAERSIQSLQLDTKEVVDTIDDVATAVEQLKDRVAKLESPSTSQFMVDDASNPAVEDSPKIAPTLPPLPPTIAEQANTNYVQRIGTPIMFLQSGNGSTGSGSRTYGNSTGSNGSKGQRITYQQMPAWQPVSNVSPSWTYEVMQPVTQSKTWSQQYVPPTTTYQQPSQSPSRTFRTPLRTAFSRLRGGQPVFSGGNFCPT